MPHARTQVRDAVKTALLGLATTANRVYIGRTRPLAEKHEPLLLIYARETRSEADSRPPRKLAHMLQLFVEGRISIRASGQNDDASQRTEALLDQIELEVATAIAADATLGDLVKDILLVRSTLSAQAPGTNHEGEVRLEFAVEYRTAETAPGVIIS